MAIPNAIPLAEVPKGSSQASNQGQGAGGEKGKGKGKGKKLFTKSNDAAKEKGVEAETQGADPSTKDIPTHQPSQKEESPAPLAKV